MNRLSIDKRTDSRGERFESAIIGLAVGDALGVPAEFMSREALRADPVERMRSGGAHGQQEGTWSDDTSMTLCMMVSLTQKGIDQYDQMLRFSEWLWNARYTARGEVFDVGITTKKAIFNFVRGTAPKECGEAAAHSCGNGSLMRILPLALYLFARHECRELNDDIADEIHSASMCTHAHRRCQMACGIYSSVVFQAFFGGEKNGAVQRGVDSALSYYSTKSEFAQVYADFEPLSGIEKRSEDEISSSGYVLHTLEAALWCFLTTGSYSECVLRAVNLGEDTDTTAAVVGGLAGLWYGQDGIHEDWIAKLAKADEIRNMSRRFAASLES